MKTSDWKKILSEEADAHVPDLCDQILSRADAEELWEHAQQEKTPMPEIKPRRAEKSRRRSGMARRIALAIAAVCLCLAVVLPIALQPRPELPPVTADTQAVVCMRINPAVEFVVEEDKVTDVRALNKDAAVLLLHNSYVGQAAENACVGFAALAERENLITQEGISLYVSGKDEAALRERIERGLLANNYSLSDVGVQVQSYAEQLMQKYGIGRGKASAAAEVLQLFPQLAEAQVVKLDAEDLYELLEDYDEGEMEEFEASLLIEYEAEYAQFVADVSKLLSEYRAELTALAEDSEEVRRGKIPAFNEKYAKLGEDFLIEEDDWKDDDWDDEFEDRLEELEELEEDLAEEADETFAELFDDWLEEFRHGHWSDDDDNDDDDDDDDDRRHGRR